MKTIKSAAVIAAMSLMTTLMATPLTNISHSINETYSGLVVFGDSLSDASTDGTISLGNNKNVITTENYYDSQSEKVQTSLGAPITNENSSGKALLWDNDLLQILQSKNIITNTQPLTPVDENLQSTAANLNYAYASAETGDNYLDDLSTNAYPPYMPGCTKPGYDADLKADCVPGVLKQIELYKQYHQKDADFMHRLYIIFAGGNDMFNNITKLINKDDKDQSNYVANLAQAVKALNAAGVTKDHIILIGIPEIAKAPAASVFLADNPAFEGIFNSLIETQNTLLYNSIKDDAQWYDAGELIRTVVKAPYTFKDIDGEEHTIYYTGGAIKAADNHYYPSDCATLSADKSAYSAQKTTCTNSSAQVQAFFNDKHPSNITHLAIAMDLYNHFYA